MQWHDAVVVAVVVEQHEVRIVFKHIAAYVAVDDGSSDVYSVGASLVVSGCRELSWSGTEIGVGWVSDGFAALAGGAEVAVRDLLGGVNLEDLHLVFTNGSELRIVASKATLMLTGMPKWFEVWRDRR